MTKMLKLTKLFMTVFFLLILMGCNQSISYTINFDTNGGGEVEPVTTDGLSPLSIPENPVKDGFVFAGWYWDNGSFEKPFTANSLLDTPISSNLTVYAKWNEYFEIFGITDANGFEIDGTDLYMEVPNATTTYSFDGQISVSSSAKWDVYTDISATVKVVSKVITLLAGNNLVYILVTDDDQVKLYEVTIRRLPYHQVTFSVDGGSPLESRTLQEGDFLEAPTTEKEGYTLTGWEDDNHQAVIFPLKIEESMQIFAKWQANQNTLSFNANGGVGEMNSVLQRTNETVKLPKNTFTKDGYSFVGWSTSLDGGLSYIDEANYEMGTLPNYVLFAKWEKTSTEGLIFNLKSDNTYEVTGYEGTSPEIFIEPKHNGISVKSISASAFSACSQVTSISIPSSVTSIGASVFSGCSSLSDITLPFIGSSKSATGDRALLGYMFGSTKYTGANLVRQYYTSSSSNTYYLPGTLRTVTITNATTIGYGTFYGCESLTEITLPETITSIGSYAFFDCKNLINILIPSNVSSIGTYSFGFCNSLAKIIIPSKVTSIESYAFQNCDSLTIFAKEISKPAGWDNLWNVSNRAVVWGYLGIGTTPDGLEYDISSREDIRITGYKGTSSEVVIPEKIENHTVRSIVTSAFSGCSQVTSISIPSSVRSIGEGAFSGCSNLTEITLPFVGASTTATEIEVLFGYIFGTNSYTGGSATTQYYFNTSYPYQYKTYYIPTTLTKVTITNASTLGSGAFYNCNNLTNITISNRLLTMEEAVFSGCGGLKTLTVPFIGKSRTATAIDSILGYMFGSSYYAGGISIQQKYSDNSITNTYCIPASLNTVIITDVTTIGYGAFMNCENVTNISLPSCVTTIAISAFSGCRSLSSLIIPNGVTSIGRLAFLDCSSLTSIVIPSSVTTMQEGAFTNCTSLTICVEDTSKPKGWAQRWNEGGRPVIWGYVSKGITSSGLEYGISLIDSSYSATITGYKGSSSEVIVPDTIENHPVTRISSHAFANLDGLQKIVIPTNVTSIENAGFLGCYSLIIYAKATSKPADWITNWNINNRLVVWGYVSNDVASNGIEYVISFINSAYHVVITGYDGSLSEVVIPSTIDDYPVTCIGDYSFENHRNLTSVVLPNSVTRIGASAFSGCGSLASIVIPQDVTSIGESAFSGCTNLASIVIPQDVASIETSVFLDCVNLIIYAKTTGIPPIWDINWNPNNRPVVWGFVSNGNTSDGFEYAIYYISSGNNVVITSYKGTTSEVKVPDTIEGYPVTNIAPFAFKNCSSVTKITIPNSVTNIGESVFNGCSSLVEMSLPFVGESRTATGANALFGYIFGTTSYIGGLYTTQYYSIALSRTYYLPTSLRTVTITNTTTLEYGAFFYCRELTSIFIPEGVQNIGPYAFYACNGLTSFTIPESVSSIGVFAFNDCGNLTKVTIPYGVTRILESAFECCEKLSSITIPNSVTHIGASAFSKCISLATIVIPNSVTSIGASVFSECSGLTEITIPFVGYSRTISGASAYFGYLFGSTSFTGGTGVRVSNTVKYKYIPEKLTKVTITDATQIVEGAFYDCSMLTTIVIPTSVTSIEGYAFHDCPSLAIYVEAASKPSGWESYWNSSNRPVVWGYVSGGVTPDGFVYGVSLIGSNYSAVITGYNGTFTEVIVPDTIEGYPVTCIAESAFMNHSNITKIMIPESVTRIGSAAFSGCSSLQEIILPFVGASRDETNANALFGYIFGSAQYTDGVSTTQYYSASSSSIYYLPATLRKVIVTDATALRYGAFFNCTKLTSISISKSIETIGERAFSGCSSLVEISLPFIGASRTATGVTALFGYVFGSTPYNYGAYTEQRYSAGTYTYYIPSALRKVVITDILKLEYGVFSNCTYLTSITISAGVTSVGARSFSNCVNLTSIIIPSSVTSIGEKAFSNCANLTSITIPYSVAGIGPNAFDYCTNLTIYARATSKPSGWDSTWYDYTKKVVWGYEG